MTPLPQTKTNEFCEQLWTTVVNDDTLSEFTLARLHREADSLESVHWDGYLIAKGMLAVIENNEKELLRIANIISASGASDAVFLNFSQLFAEVGKIIEALVFAKKAWEKAPLNSNCIEHVICYAAAIGDNQAVETAMEAWHKLHPDVIHPLLQACLLNMKSYNKDEHTLEKYLQNSLNMVQIAINKKPISCRRKHLIKKLLDRVES
ncbi:MAG: hypothetical protein LBJ47_03810 [Tannerella sp.]|jgi:hypothetical protein|nr:hypothetical protein [Tannerella sp.]